MEVEVDSASEASIVADQISGGFPPHVDVELITGENVYSGRLPLAKGLSRH